MDPAASSDSAVAAASAPSTPAAVLAAEPHWSDGDVGMESKLKQRVLEDLDTVLDKAGGPVQYLSTVNMDEFGDWLWDTFPEQDDVLYHHKAKLPPVLEAEIAECVPLVIHVAALGCDQTCSLKPPPGKALCLQLAEQFLIEGFLTNTTHSGPLLVLERTVPASKPGPLLWQCADDDLRPFSLGYLKGMARASSLLALLHRLFVMKTNMPEEFPILHRSLLRVQCHHVHHTSRVDEALSNMRMSCRGSLVKATNTLQAVVMIKNLQQMGLTNHMQFVRKWNLLAAKQFQFSGKRLTALKLLFDETPEVGSHVVGPWFFTIMMIFMF